MQKKLIAVAVAGALAAPLAMAQTNVTISGLLKAGYENYKLKSAGVSYDNEHKISDQSSRIIFAGTEDLGGGLKAWFQLDARFNTDTGDTNPSNNGTANWASGNTGVGLLGGFGKITLGRWDVHYNEFGAIESNRAGSLQTLFGNGLMSQVADGAGNSSTIANGTRTPNLLMWDSPNWNGFTARLAYSAAPFQNNEASGVNDGSKGDAWSGALRYAGGPFIAGLSYWDGEQEDVVGNTGFDQKSARAWAGFTFPFGLKVGLGFDRSELENRGAGSDLKRNAWMLPVSYAFGPSTVYATYSRAGDVSGLAGDQKAQAWMVGYDYAFSKRTSIGAFWTQLKNKGNGGYNFFQSVSGDTLAGSAGISAGADPRQLYIGIAHSF